MSHLLPHDSNFVAQPAAFAGTVDSNEGELLIRTITVIKPYWVGLLSALLITISFL